MKRPKVTKDGARKALLLVTRAVEQKMRWIQQEWDTNETKWTELQKLSVVRYTSQELASPTENLWHGLLNEKCPWTNGFTDNWEGE